MKINNINNPSFLPSSKKNIEPKDVKKNEVSDSIQISSEARELLSQDRISKLNEIKEKLNQNFYSRKEVIEKTAEAILKELKSE